MNSKVLYVGSMVLLLASVLAIGRLDTPKIKRVQQHESYNQDVTDTSLSIESDSFSTHLPIISIHTGGVAIPGRPSPGVPVSAIKNEYISAQVQVIALDGQLNTLQAQPNIDSSVQIRVRGNSSRYFDKAGYLLKFIDKNGNNKKQEVLGMEEESTWVLHGPFLDKTLMRNYMWYNLSGQIMDWAPDVRYCEVFLDDAYQGVYVIAEQIDVAEGRIEVEKYRANSPVSSYVLSLDRPSINVAEEDYLYNFTYYARRTRNRTEIKYPPEKYHFPELIEYINQDFSKFEKSLYSYDFDSRRYGYPKYIDVDNFVDYVIINEITQNTDAGIFSTFMYKDVSGKLKMAVWDFNNCCDNYIEEQQSMAGFFMHTRPWFFMLLKDEAFTDKVIDRYRQLRKSVLADDALKSYIASVQEYLGPAIDRNFQVWGDSFLPENDLLQEDFRKIGSYEEAVDQYQRRLISRLGWMDQHIESLYAYSDSSSNKKFNH